MLTLYMLYLYKTTGNLVLYFIYLVNLPFFSIHFLSFFPKYRLPLSGFFIQSCHCFLLFFHFIYIVSHLSILLKSSLRPQPYHPVPAFFVNISHNIF